MTTIPFPNKTYDIIYADPPWLYGASNEKRHYSNLAPELHYDCISFEKMERLPVNSIASDDCLLFMWVVSPDMDKCIDVGKAWGFDYITVAFVWEKQQIVPSFYTLSSCELCLVFKRGRIPKPRGKRNVRQFVEEPEVVKVKRGGHSVKPIQIRERITEMFPEQSKIELFARPNWTDYDRDWDFWGNEVGENKKIEF